MTSLTDSFYIKLQKRRGFSLAEIIVSIGIISMLISSLLITGANFRWVTTEANYFNAVRLLQINEALLKEKDFDALPPEIFSIPEDGVIKLSNKFIIPDSLIIITPQGEMIVQDDYSLDADNGIINLISLNYANQDVIVKYSFLIPDTLETGRVPLTEPYQIEPVNSPVISVVSVEKLDGDSSYPVSKSLFSLDLNQNAIIFDESLAGEPVMLTYTGGGIKSICSGRFIDPGSMQESIRPTSLKFIELNEAYGSGGNNINSVILKKR